MDHFSGAPLTHPVVACAEEIRTVLKAVADVDPGFMSAADQRTALEELTGLESLLGELRLRVIAASEQVAQAEGCRDVAAWLVAHQREDRTAAARAQRLATALTQRWTPTGTAVREGAASVDQARVITRALDRLASELDQAEAQTILPAAERELIRLAAHHTPAELDRLGERILTVVAPQIADAHERAALDRAERAASAATRLRIQRRGDGATDIRARVPDHVAARLKTYLDAYTSPRVNGGKPGTGVIDSATGERIPYERLLGEAFCTLLESIDPSGCHGTAHHRPPWWSPSTPTSSATPSAPQ
ncbi:DUF222 domain-containing protein [Nocardioides sp.]|uniref:DUF222 domain-containing protein n=1 Tax=Nocardioides sp. TaxID=35761 RepID=UPI002733818F|nr:DUF222 domain-containing protein [Nocardioides sp.]MDP3894441.1 DUF222 domain-containing protein [Nocardioides sp.]